jgi:1-acyl-sn-glycerol-3-phosphate acyltransferase
MKLRRIIHIIMRFLLFIIFRTKVIDKENVPGTGGYIVATNHLGTLDAPLVFASIDRQDITALVAKKHQKSPLMRFLFNAVGGIWINREEADTQAMRAALDLLKSGGMLGVAPEGTRSKTGTMIPAKTGAAYLADRAGTPVIPAAITGTYRAVWNLLRLKRPHIAIQFGKAFTLLPVNRKTREADLQRNTDEIMCRVAAMLPPEYRGIYAEHPRLKELLSEGKGTNEHGAEVSHPLIVERIGK